MSHITIIGGGIAGLYLQNLILNKTKHKVTLIERMPYLGGRIHTFNTKVNNISYSMEAGAGRFSDNHKILLSLINKFKLKNKIFKLSSDLAFFPKKNKYKNNPITKYLPYDYIDLIVKDIGLNKSMSKYTFKEWLNKHVNKKIVDYIIDTYPYKDMFKINAYDALRLYKKDLNINNNFYVLGGGLSQIIDKLEKENLKLGGKIMKGVEVLNVKKDTENKNKKCFIITHSGGKPFLTNKVVFTCQRPDLLKFKILNEVKPMINSVFNEKLCRIYFIFDTKNCVWFKNIKKSITDSRISYFIPINYEKGLVMISYVDAHNASYLAKMELENKNKFINFILDECKDIFKIEKIPKPIWTKSFYWEHGVGDWKKGTDSSQISKNIIKPIKYENIYICGENYSRDYQCWIEGGLETALKVFNKLK